MVLSAGLALVTSVRSKLLGKLLLGGCTSGELRSISSGQHFGRLAGRQGVGCNGGRVVVVTDGGAVVDALLAESEYGVLLVQSNCLVEGVKDSVRGHCTARNPLVTRYV